MPESIISYLIGALIVGFGLLMLAVIFRFSVLSPRRIRGSRAMLRTPDREGVERAAGLTVPSDLVWLYKEVPFVERMEFELVDGSKMPPHRWTIGEFSALIGPVVQEMRAISRVPGIPIASDMDKGTYFVDESGAVLLASPDVPGGRVQVAPTVRAFAAFEPRECADNDA
jgi:hypothetical protein